MKPGIGIRTARHGLALAVCALALLAGCSSGSATSGSSPSAAAPASSSSAAASPSGSDLCANAAALRASLDQLRHVNVQAGAVGQITSDLNDTKAALTKLVTDAHGQFQTQTSALSATLDTLKTAVSSLGASPGVSTVSGAVSALGQVNTAAQNLLAAVNTDCPSASPSSSA
jgi:major membrane immunogen (membrane-anchored lipoprotein)